ncbi:MAG: UDP-N-acetylmuramoyl-L-alanine--D-glutamate ligase [Anaerolineae bacterium]|nr:UDP-N-acetylmuramoyl-L-alanine--D-glutamate ligase [Anaerolineae bacterium]MDW8100966.1 UDP-N-acetylmuramoyl-L-alanine--D-glutamate ligase [Anaerolineae bacterium]
MSKAWAGKSVVILGLARQGMALARFFVAQGARVTVSDQQPAAALQPALAALNGLPIRYVLGGHPETLLDGCDLLCLSGGVPTDLPIVQTARAHGIPLSNDAQLTLELSPAPVIGITGSAGKTTTTTLVGEIMRTAGMTAHVGGNIGLPLIDRLETVHPSDWVVLEMSSFQLELCTRSPHIAAVLNVTPNHLDRHPSMSHYAAAKANILRWQGTADVAVLGVDDEVTGAWWRAARVTIPADRGQPAVDFPLIAGLVGFSGQQMIAQGTCIRDGRVVWRWADDERIVLSLDEVQLRGWHNVLNVLAACAIAGAAGASPAAMAQAVRGFRGVEHRLELVREHNGVLWINDSIATAPERALAALRSFDQPIVLLAGGRDKKLPWDVLAREIGRRVRYLICFGEAGPMIAKVVRAKAEEEGDRRLEGIQVCPDLAAAVHLAVQVARPGDVVLLSPGGTSFDAYRDFAERGEHFRRLVQAL